MQHMIRRKNMYRCNVSVYGIVEVKEVKLYSNFYEVVQLLFVLLAMPLRIRKIVGCLTHS